MADPARGPDADLERSETTPITIDAGVKNYSNDEKKDLVHSDDLLQPSEDGHYVFLDVTRIICIACVCLDHGEASFGEWNYILGQGWILQYLFLVAGVSFGISKKPLNEYLFRLAKYVMIGIFVNLTAWVLKGQSWLHNPFGVVFQLWFVVALIGYCAILHLLKPHLQRLRERNRKQILEEASTDSNRENGAGEAQHSESRLTVLTWIVGGMLFIFLLIQAVVSPLLTELLAGPTLQLVGRMGSSGEFWGLPTDLRSAKVFIHRICGYFMLTGQNLYLLFICPKVLQRVSLTPWVLIINTYCTRACVYRGAEERFFHGFDLAMLGLTCLYTGISYRKQIGEYMARYWFLVIFAASVCFPPGLEARLDETPPHDMILRARYAAMECILIILWLTAGERLVQKELFTVDRLDFLNDWALLAFLAHKAVHMSFPSPANWVIIFGIMPFVCYYLRRTAKDS